MTTPTETLSFSEPATEASMERAAAALREHGFVVEILDDVDAAHQRIKELIPEGASVFTGASETLRLSGIEADISTSGHYDAIRPWVLAADRATQADEMRRRMATPDFVVSSLHAVTETGSLVIASGTGTQLSGHAGGAARSIWVVGAQKIVPDLDTALRRVYEHSLPLESARTQEAYGSPSAVNRMLILNAEPFAGRATVLLLRQTIGF
jgi:L-lactate utilization protein LutC